MSYLETNSTESALPANTVFTGRSTRVDAKYITLQISIITDQSGILEVYHSHDGKIYNKYDDVVTINEGSKHVQFSIKGSYLFVKYTNGNTNQNKLSLHSKLSIQPRENMSVQLDYHDDSVSIPNLEQALTQINGETYQNILMNGKNINNIVESVKMSNNKINVIDVSNNELLTSINDKTIDTSNINGSVTVLNPVSSVSVSNFPATQPISGSVSANITNASIPVTGTFYQATQPISGSVSANITNASIPVTGTFYQATQPISGSVSANITNASIPVTGTFYQATQPISGSVSANITNESIPVTGTFYQATQPISGSVSANITNASIPVTGTFYQAIQPVSFSNSAVNMATYSVAEALTAYTGGTIRDLSSIIGSNYSTCYNIRFCVHVTGTGGSTVNCTYFGSVDNTNWGFMEQSRAPCIPFGPSITLDRLNVRYIRLYANTSATYTMTIMWNY